MACIYPEKFAFIGKEIANVVVDSAAAEAKQYGLPEGRGAAVLAGMKFVLGHRIWEDPYYSGISTTLRDPLPADGADRLRQLLLRAGEREL